MAIIHKTNKNILSVEKKKHIECQKIEVVFNIVIVNF